MIVYSNGCSHTRGACRNRYEDSYVYIFLSSLVGKNNFVSINKGFEDIHFKNPNLYKNLEPNIHYNIFDADYGKSNDKILYETYNQVLSAVQEGVQIDYAIIQLSGVNRRMHWDMYGNLINVNLHNNVELGPKFEPTATHHSIQQIIILQNLFQKYNIEYVFIPYMEFDSVSLSKNPYLNMIDFSRFTTSLNEGHRNDFRKKLWVCDTHGHPNYIANYYLANKVLELFNYDDCLMGFWDYFSDTDVAFFNAESTFIKKYYNKLGDATSEIIKKLKN